jgi:outer membrane protein assembly factor BamD
VGPSNTAAIPAAQAPAPAPEQINEIRPGTAQQSAATAEPTGKKKAPKADLDKESSSKKKKKKGLGKLNPF